MEKLHNDLENCAGDYIEIEKYGRFLKKEVAYYFNKFFFLKKNGYFTEINQKDELNGTVDASAIITLLANVNQVVFETTDRCNLNCSYCTYGGFYYDYDKRENKNMDVRCAKKLFEYLVPLWNSPLNMSHNRNINIGFYGGEPLMNAPFISEIVDYVNQLNVIRNHFTFSMTTNGTLVKKYMDFLYEKDFNLVISLDGNDQNNLYRVFKNGKPVYNTIIENVYALQKKYPNYFLKRVNFNAVLHNKNSISEIYHFFKRCFNKIPSIIGLNPSGIKEFRKKEFWKTFANTNQSLHESEDYSIIEKDMFYKLPNTQDVLRFLFNSNDFCFGNYKYLIHSTDSKKSVPTGTCLPFSLKIFLTVNGKILPCERIGQQFSLGHVNSDGVELEFEKIAAKYNNYYNKMRKQCNFCYNAEFCSQCMFNLDKLEDINFNCNGFMDEKEYSSYLSSFLNYFENEPESFSRILNGNNHE